MNSNLEPLNTSFFYLYLYLSFLYYLFLNTSFLIKSTTEEWNKNYGIVLTEHDGGQP